MAEIRRYPFLRHLRSETSSHVLVYGSGRLKKSARALCFWFTPLSTSVAEVPIDDQEVTFVLHGKTSDFQDATVQGVLSYRIEDPELAAARLDFSLDLVRGRHLKQPLDNLTQLVTQLVSELALGWVGKVPLALALSEGQDEIRERVESGLHADVGLRELGLRVVALRVAPVRPAPEVERALEVPARERIQEAADEASFARRAQAVEKERAIQENELNNRIELARREEDLIAQQGVNGRRKVVQENEAKRLDAEASAVREQIGAKAETEAMRLHALAEADARRATATAEAEAVRLIETARVDTERARMDIYRELPAHVLAGLAAQELAGKLGRVERIEITPDSLGNALVGIARAVLPAGGGAK